MNRASAVLAAVLLGWPAISAFGAEEPGGAAPQSAPEKFRYEVSVGYLGRDGAMYSGDDTVIEYGSRQCNWFFCWTPVTGSYENEGYQVSYQAAPRVSARMFFLKYGWLGLSLEQVKGSLSTNLDSDPGSDPVTSRYELGTIEGERVALSIGGRWTWRESVDLYGGLSLDVVGERFTPGPPICVSGAGCNQYRVRASAKPGTGLLLGAAVPMTRSLYLATELTVHGKEWDYVYEWSGEGTDVLPDKVDHLDQTDIAYSLTVTYRF